MRYYRRLGFSEVRDVGDDWRGLADRAVWGGVGAQPCAHAPPTGRARGALCP